MAGGGGEAGAGLAGGAPMSALHARLLHDKALQFAFDAGAPPQPPHIPEWLKALGRFLARAFETSLPVLKILFWVGVGLVVAGVLFLILREVVGVRFARRRRAANPRAAVADWRADTRKARALLENADRLADQGRFDQAVRLILHRSVEDIDDRRPRLVRPALTARELSAAPDVPDVARAAFTKVAAIVEFSAFAGQPVGLEAYQQCRAAYEEFALPGGVGVSGTPAQIEKGSAAPAFASPFTLALVIGVGVFAFCAFLVLGAYAPDLKGGDNGQAHAMSKSAIGFGGLVEAVKLAGDPTMISRGPLPPGRKAGLLVATPGPGEENGAGGVAFDGPVLVVLSKWETVPDPTHPGWVKRIALIDNQWAPTLVKGASIARRRGVSRVVLSGTAAPFTTDLRLAEGPVDSFQTVKEPGWIPVLTDETGAVVLARDPKRPLYVLSDPDLLNTQGLKNIDTLSSAVTILRALRVGDGPMMFDVTLNGLGKARSVLRLLFDPPFLSVTLSLAAALALAVWQALIRFGPLRHAGRAIAYGKTALVDNTAALINIARREHAMGAPYALLTAEIAAKAVGAPRDLTGEPLTQFLDRLGAQRGAVDTYRELESQARLAQEPGRMAATARRLYLWRLAMTRENN